MKWIVKTFALSSMNLKQHKNNIHYFKLCFHLHKADHKHVGMYLL